METILLSLSFMGSWVIFFGLMVMFIPTELVLAFGGFLIVKGYTSFEQALFAAVIGGVLSQLVLYLVAKYGGRRAIERFGKYIFLNTRRSIHLEHTFKKYGAIVLILGRVAPGSRSLASVAAGLANMGIWTFTFYTTVAIFPISYMILYLGTKLGKNWTEITKILEIYTPFITVGVLIAVLITIQLKKIRLNRVRMKQESQPQVENSSSFI